MSTQLPTLSGNQLYLWPIIREAIAFPWHYRQLLWKWVLVCGALVGLINFVSEILYVPAELEAEELSELFEISGLLYDLVFIVLLDAPQIILYTVFCIRCHRLVLLGSRTQADPFPPQFDKREFTFFSFLVIISVGAVVVGLLIGIPISLVWFVLSNLLGFSDMKFEALLIWPMLGLPAAYLFGRCCMVFPAIAIDLQPSLTWAWKQSKDFAWRLGILAGFLPWLFSSIHNESMLFGLDQHHIVNSLIMGILGFAFTTIEVAVLSIAFRELSGWKNLKIS